MLTVLTLLLLIANSGLLGRVLLLYQKKRTNLNKILLISLSAFGLTIYFDCYRLISLHLIGTIADFTYQIYFCYSVFLTFFAISIAFRALFIFNRQAGHKIHKEFLIRAFLTIILIAITVINLYTFYRTDYNELGIYTYQLHPLLAQATLLIYIPTISFLILKSRFFLKEIQDPRLRNPLLLFFSIFVVLSIERGFSIGYFWLFPNSIITLYIDLSILTLSLFMLLAISLLNPGLLEDSSCALCVQSIYLMNKRGGLLVFSHHLTKNSSNTLDQNSFLLGGFIHSISHGLEQTIIKGGEMEAIAIGNTSIIFKSGRYVLGIIFATEPSPILHLKLLGFLQRFEQIYQEHLKSWNGNLNVFEQDEIIKWIYETFR